MDFQLSEEELVLQKLAREIADREFKPRASRWDENEEYPTENLPILLQAGFMGISLPVEYGGAGGEAIDAILVMEQVARVCPSTAMIVFGGNLGPVRCIAHFGTEEQKRKYIPPVCKEGMGISISMSEPDAGSAMTDLTTRAVLQGDVFVVNGVKRFVSGAGLSQVYLVYVRFGNIKGAKGIGALLIEKDTPGFSFGKKERKMGMRGMPHADLIFEDCRVPEKNLLMRDGELHKLLMAANLERCANGTLSLGIGQGALEEALAYSKQRVQFGRPICEFQGVQWMLADMAIKVEAARLLIYRAAANAGQGFASIMETSIAKTFANEMAVEVANTAIQVHGSYGYTRDFPLERMLRDARGWTIAGGTVQIQRNTIASLLLGRKFSQRKN